MAASDIRREDVLEAIAEYDQRGVLAFLEKYGLEFENTHGYRVAYRGEIYPTLPLVAAARAIASGSLAVCPPR